MAKLAIVATIKTKPGKREEYLGFLSAHGKRCRESEPGTLAFDIMLPQSDPDTILLYEVYANKEAFDLHVSGSSMKQIRQEASDLQVSLTGVRCDLME